MQTNYKAFTLIELLVVVLIIGVLAAVAVPQYKKAVLKSQFAPLLSFVQQLAKAEQVYYLENGIYTDDLANLTAIDTSGWTPISEPYGMAYRNTYLLANGTFCSVWVDKNPKGVQCFMSRKEAWGARVVWDINRRGDYCVEHSYGAGSYDKYCHYITGSGPSPHNWHGNWYRVD